MPASIVLPDKLSELPRVALADLKESEETAAASLASVWARPEVCIFALHCLLGG